MLRLQTVLDVAPAAAVHSGTVGDAVATAPCDVALTAAAAAGVVVWTNTTANMKVRKTYGVIVRTSHVLCRP